jgi:non-ribosomal peptide synthetase component F
MRVPGHSPLCQTFFTYQREGDAALPFGAGQLSLAPVAIYKTAPKYELVIAVREGATISIRLEFRSDIYEQATMERFAHRLELMLATCIEAPTRTLASLDVLLDSERTVAHTGFQTPELDEALSWPVTTKSTV